MVFEEVAFRMLTIDNDAEAYFSALWNYIELYEIVWGLLIKRDFDSEHSDQHQPDSS